MQSWADSREIWRGEGPPNPIGDQLISLGTPSARHRACTGFSVYCLGLGIYSDYSLLSPGSSLLG